MHGASAPQDHQHELSNFSSISQQNVVRPSLIAQQNIATSNREVYLVNNDIEAFSRLIESIRRISDAMGEARTPKVMLTARGFYRGPSAMIMEDASSKGSNKKMRGTPLPEFPWELK
ncbi:hypothetical protein F0562_023731 [Nyssa sinensis]|uniref:Uncharacterized protein n=1 Tax=Nyssa sinensis TaxID=561372 RepID=A0A5J5BIJ9_9ASTE|nr:hypothetical protein F0562_023731 [Nyssa sinensis]